MKTPPSSLRQAMPCTSTLSPSPAAHSLMRMRSCCLAATIILLACSQVAIYATTYTDNLAAITAGFMPDPGYSSVKVPGLNDQINAAWNIWKNVAPGYTNVPTNVIVSGNTITMQLDIVGLVRSIDGGQTWKYVGCNQENGITSTVFDFDISPANSNIIVQGGSRIYRSTDNGRTWSAPYVGLPLLKYYSTRQNAYGQVKYNCDGTVLFSAIGTLPFSPAGIEAVIAANYTYKSIFHSSDNASTFTETTTSRPFAVIKKIYPHPDSKDIVYFSFGDGDFFVTLNATAPTPTLNQIPVPAGYFVRAMCVNPGNFSEMLLTLTKADGTSSRLYRSTNCKMTAMTMSEVPLISPTGAPYSCKDLLSVGYNPHNPGQVVLGESGTSYLYVSTDNLAHFTQLKLSDEAYHDGNQTEFYGQIERVYFGQSSAVVVSRIGAWMTSDDFSTFEELGLTYDSSNGQFGNKGFGGVANTSGMSIGNQNVYFSAQDHGAWRSNGSDLDRWVPTTGPLKYSSSPQQPAPWGSYTWFWQVERTFASSDERFVYINCNAYMSGAFTSSFWRSKKFMCSYDHGETWNDITAKLGAGDVYPEGSAFLKILFDPASSSRHWLLTTDAVYFTSDGGASFTKLNSDLFTGISYANNKRFSDIAYDAGHKVLYLSARTGIYPQTDKLNFDSAPAALYKSSNYGQDWTISNVGQNAIASLGVTASGTLVIGSQKTADQPARLVVIPYGQAYNENMVKLTVGDTAEEISANQISIWPIICDGEDVLAYSNTDWIQSDRAFAQGPLLSQDGGSTFKWIHHNLPVTCIWSAAMKNGRILLGTTAGIMSWEYKPDALKAYWKLDETAGTTASDSCGAFNGVNSGATFTASGAVNAAYSFNGTSSYVSVPKMNFDELTVSAWFYRNSRDTVNADAIFGAHYWNANAQLQEGFDLKFWPGLPDRLYFALVTTNSSGVRTVGNCYKDLGAASVGNWHHMAATYNKATGEQKLYVDGQLATTFLHTAGNTIVPLSAYPDMRIGHSRTNTGYFPGLIDDVKVFSSPVSADQVTLEYTVKAQVAHWKLDEVQGNTVVGDSCGANNGSNYGAASVVSGKQQGNALSFNGTSSYVSVPKMNFGEITVSAWFYRNSRDTVNADAVFGGHYWNANAQFQEGFDLKFWPGLPDRLNFTVVTTNSSGARTIGGCYKDLGAASAGNWYYVAGTYNKASGEQKLYVNGQLATTFLHAAGNTIVPLSAYPDMRIGHSRTNAGYFPGLIDGVRIFRRPLTPGEIDTIFQAENR